MDMARGHEAEFVLEDVEGGYSYAEPAENPGELEAVHIVATRNYIGQAGDGREAIHRDHERARAFIK